MCDPQLELICCKKRHLETLEIPTPLGIAVGSHFHVQYGINTILAFLHPHEEASWSLLPSLVCLLSGSTVQPGNTNFCITATTGVHLPNPGSTDLTIKSGLVLTNPIRKNGA